MIVALVTTGSRPPAFRIPLGFKEQEGLILPDHIRTVDKRRLVKRLGAVAEPVPVATLDRLRELFQL